MITGPFRLTAGMFAGGFQVFRNGPPVVRLASNRWQCHVLSHAKAQ